MDSLKIPDYVSNERFLKDFTSRCALSSEREMLALLADARPDYSIQVDSRLMEGKVTSYLPQVVKRNIKEVLFKL